MPKDKSYAVYKQMTLTRANSLFANYAVAKIRIFFLGASRTIVALPAHSSTPAFGNQW